MTSNKNKHTPKAVVFEMLKNACQKIGIKDFDLKLDWPSDLKRGDISTNIAMVLAKKENLTPLVLGQKLLDEIKKDNDCALFEKVELVSPGFINFYFSKLSILQFIKKESDEVVSLNKSSNKKVMVEYTDPNLFKIFHIGHLMANAIGESFSRIIESDDTKVIRSCYQGDVGLHVAKTIWAVLKNKKELDNILSDDVIVKDKVAFLGKMYVIGNTAYEEDHKAKKEISDLNEIIFKKSDEEINDIYNEGKRWSLEYFEGIYSILNTKFDKYYLESEVADLGIDLVKQFTTQGVFEESEGAIVYKGEKDALHTRVFINSKGLPTYETKELGLNKIKFKDFPDLDKSIIVTANEQNDYFKVLLSVMSYVYPDIRQKIVHKSHGILRFKEGKMSSRKGNIITGEELIEEVKSAVRNKMKDHLKSNEDLIKEESNIEKIAIGAIKYIILRQAVGTDVIYDPKTIVSFEGDSGPYLQYSCVRARSVLEKAKKINIKIDQELSKDTIEKMKSNDISNELDILIRLLARFKDVIDRARYELSPQYIVTYLSELSIAFNSFYSNESIAVENDPTSNLKIYITNRFAVFMEKGLSLLAIQIPERM